MKNKHKAKNKKTPLKEIQGSTKKGKYQNYNQTKRK